MKLRVSANLSFFFGSFLLYYLLLLILLIVKTVQILTLPSPKSNLDFVENSDLNINFKDIPIIFPFQL